MKTKILLIVSLLLLGTLSTSSKNAVNTAIPDETIRICTTTDTRTLVESWTTNYRKSNPEINFEIKSTNFSEFNNAIAAGNTLGFMIKRPDVSMIGESMWKMVVGRDIIVPVISRENPFAETLKEKGVLVNDLSALIKSGKSPDWNQLLENVQNAPVHFYILDKPEVKLSVSKFLEFDPIEVKSLESKPADEILQTLRNDEYAVAFCRLADVVNPETQDFDGAIALLPMDRNSNGKLDFGENIYADLESFERAVWIGKYPKSLIYNIYAVASTQPENDALTGFLSWVVTTGQQQLEENGYLELVSNEVQSNLEKLTPSFTFAALQNEKGTNVRAYILGAIVLGLVLFFIAVFVNVKGKSVKRYVGKMQAEKTLNEAVLDFPGGVFYDKSHTWVFMEKDGTVKVGIDDFLQHVTGDYTGIIMKEPGEKLSKNQPAVTLINDGKKINIYAPVSGTIKEINEDLVDFPSLINNSPYAWGWIYAMEPSNWFREIGFLNMADSYKEWIKKEFIRLKDFLASINQNQMLTGQLVYQEGGELKDHVLHDFDPKVWEEFQTRFIDNSDMN